MAEVTEFKTETGIEAALRLHDETQACEVHRAKFLILYHVQFANTSLLLPMACYTTMEEATAGRAQLDKQLGLGARYESVIAPLGKWGSFDPDVNVSETLKKYHESLSQARRQLEPDTKTPAAAVTDAPNHVYEPGQKEAFNALTKEERYKLRLELLEARRTNNKKKLQQLSAKFGPIAIMGKPAVKDAGPNPDPEPPRDPLPEQTTAPDGPQQQQPPPPPQQPPPQP